MPRTWKSGTPSTTTGAVGMTVWSTGSVSRPSVEGCAASGALRTARRRSRDRNMRATRGGSAGDCGSIITAALHLDRLPEPEDMAVAVAHGELEHAIGVLHERTVDDIGAAVRQLGVQSPGVVDPEEGVPGPALGFDRLDAIGLVDAAQHDAVAIAAQDRELGGSPCQVLALEAQDTLIEP